VPANWLPVPHRKQTRGAADCLAACATYVNDPYFDQAPQRVPREEFILAWLEKDYRCAIISLTAPQ
jgi:hypothetical protein